MRTEFISIVGALLLAAATYWLTKKREVEAEWRKEKLGHYKAFVDSLSKILDGESTPEGQVAFAKACNDLLLFAPQFVIEALAEFQNETRTSNPNKSQEKHDEVLSKLFLAMRKDVGVIPKDKQGTFKIRLWASGVRKTA